MMTEIEPAFEMSYFSSRQWTICEEATHCDTPLGPQFTGYVISNENIGVIMLGDKGQGSNYNIF
jgi:hypothetical protein